MMMCTRVRVCLFFFAVLFEVPLEDPFVTGRFAVSTFFCSRIFSSTSVKRFPRAKKRETIRAIGRM